MITNRGTVSSAAKADAAHQAQVAEQWRDWHTYLESHLKLLDAQQAETTVLPSFERQPTSWEVQREQAEAAIKRIPAVRRTIFDRERDLRREEVQRDLEQAQRAHGTETRPTPIDADVIDRETLQGLLQEAEGRDSPSERGLVPMGDGRWYEVHVPSLMTVPNAADYSVGEFDDSSKRRRLATIGGLIFVLVLGMWLTWPRGKPVIAASTRHAPEINGAAVQPWTVQSVLLVGENSSTTILSATATTEQVWPALRNAIESVAYWRSTALMPMELCVHHEHILRAASLRLRATATLPERAYTLQETAPARYDLLLTACGVEADRIVRYGTLTTVAPLPAQEMNQAVSLPGDHTLRLREIRVVGPGQDTTLPAQQYRVLLRVETSEDLDWSLIAPTLLLVTGNALLPGDTVPLIDGAELRYLVPAFDAPLDAAWMIATGGEGHDRHWRVTLEPPPSRVATLRQSLHVTTVTAEPSPPGTESQLTIDVHNLGSAPLQLTPDDLTLSQGGSPLIVPAIAALRTPLAVGEKRTLQVTLHGVKLDQPLVVTVGAERFGVRWR